MATVILVEATPRNASDGQPATVRLAGGGAAVPYRYADQHWRAGISSLPRSVASLDYDDQQLGGGVVAQAMDVLWSPASKTALAELAGLFWTDAPVTIRIGAEGPVIPPIVAAGLVLDAAVDGTGLRIGLADAQADLKRPLLVDRFAGTGGIEGPVEFKDQIKSRAWGRCFNVPGRQLVAGSNIWVFGDPRRPWKSFDAVRDRGAAADPATLTLLAWQGSAEATLAALVASAAIEGGGVLCPSIAAIKWWTVPSGDLHADIRGETEGGYVETAPEIAARIAAARSTIPFAAGAVAAAAIARPAPCGWRVDTEGATAAGEISDLLGGVSTSWLLVDDAIVFRHWDWTAPTRAVRSVAVTRKSVAKPIGSRKLGYRRNWSPMARGDLAAIVLSTDVVYGDGTPIEDLKPAQPGADVTGDNTAADTHAVYGRAAAEIVGSIDVNVTSIIEQALRQDDLVQVFDARTLVEGQPVGTVFLEFRNDQQTADTATASTLALIGAKTPDGTAFNLAIDTVRVAPDQTLAQRLSEITAETGTLTASVQTLNEAFATDSGGYAKFLLSARVDANGRISLAGVSGSASPTTSELNFVAENFNFVRSNGGTPLKLLSYNGALNRWEFPADVYAKKIVADSIETINLKSGSVTGLTSYAFADQAVGTSEITLAEVSGLVIGDGVDGRALAIVSFTQDGSAVADTSQRIRAYVDTGGGYVLVRNKVQGIAVGSGSARWILSQSFPVSLMGESAVSLKITAQGNNLAGGPTSGSYARDIQIDIFRGSR